MSAAGAAAGPALCMGVTPARREFWRSENANDHERDGARTSGVTDLIVVVPAMEPRGCHITMKFNAEAARRFRAGAPSFRRVATARPRSFSTPLTSTAIAAVAKTKPSAMTAVVPSTRPKPPRPCRTAIADTAAPETRKVRKYRTAKTRPRQASAV